MIKNYFRILKKPHAYLQTILKTPVKFQKDRTETVGGVKGTKYPLKTRNHAPRAMRHAPRTTENQKQCPSTFLRKGGGQKNTTNLSSAELAQRVVKVKYTVKPVLVVTSIKQPTCIKQPEESCPEIHRLLYLNCIKQPPAFSSHILSFPWVAA